MCVISSWWTACSLASPGLYIGLYIGYSNDGWLFCYLSLSLLTIVPLLYCKASLSFVKRCLATALWHGGDDDDDDDDDDDEVNVMLKSSTIIMH